jgi:hypothetical protein
LEERAGVFTRRLIPEQLPGHAEVYVQKPAFEIEKDLLASAADSEDCCTSQGACSLHLITTRDQARVKLGLANRSSDEMRSKRSNDSFDFWEFGQGV